MQLFACRGDKPLHTLSPSELPMELLNPLNKFGYYPAVETPDGLKRVESFNNPVVTTVDGKQYKVQ